MRPPLRIATLECGPAPPNADKQYNGFGGMFEVLLTSSAKALNQPERLNPENGLEISEWDIYNNKTYPQLEDIDAVLLTGSEDDAFEDVPWINRLVEFTQQVLAQDRVRILGICFGHQIVGRALGAKVGRNDQGWEAAVCDVDLTEKGKELFGLEKLQIQQMHLDLVFDCPPGVTLLGSSPLCAVQGMYTPRRFMTVQGHPEFEGELQTEIIKSLENKGIFSEVQSRDALDRVHIPHDGVAIGSTFLTFLLEE
ncbi:hypothetical protein N7478_004666 [Penicillium angulare]|uniref:uncharacterized protein n=1 Tax=Penicillium angulare TaxID=116970 RepID=UPI002540E628|nr:uncharacterized protein N7478_004666 [Penicillium angulare]KAJ5279294.1 hypothetical protein N7478_004666 [Penicillium angulare]